MMGHTITLQSIAAPVKSDLKAVLRFIQTQLDSSIPLIQQMMRYVASHRGKGLRPLLVCLCARVCHVEGDWHIQLAAIIELIHTATLLHDDVIDRAVKRRHSKTANAIWGNTASVLAGDFLHSRSFQLITALGHTAITQALADTSNRMVEGEMMQLANRNRCDMQCADYLSVIERKTAALFAVATHGAALLSASSEKTAVHLRTYGHHLGMAYQLMDDLLDYHAEDAQTGKSRGNDLAEGKPTLPLIYTLQRANKIDAKRISEALRDGDATYIDALLPIMHETGALDATFEKAKAYVEEAQQCLSHLPASIYRDCLCDLGDFILSRHVTHRDKMTGLLH